MTEEIGQDAPQEQASVPAGKKRQSKRRLLWLMLGMLSAILIANLGIAGFTIIGRKPLSYLPGVKAMTIAVPPQHLFSIYGVGRPMGVALGPDGQRLYVTEGGGEQRVRIFNPAGKPLGAFAPTDNGAFMPVGIAVDRGGRVFVADVARGAVLVFAPDGQSFDTVTSPNGERLTPRALAFDHAGRLYVTEGVEDGPNHVLVFDDQLKFLREFGEAGTKKGALEYPEGVALDGQGRVYVSSQNARVEVYNAEGNLLSGGDKDVGIPVPGLPRWMAVDDQGRLHVVNVLYHQVFVYDVSGASPRSLFAFGDQGIEDGQFSFPEGIAVDTAGRVYVADRANNRVSVWTY